MKLTMKAIWRILLTTLFWLCIQLCVILALEILGFLPSRLFNVRLYGIQGAVASYIYTWACCIVGLVYTVTGSILLEKVSINSKRWWIIAGCCYALYMVSTAAGFLVLQGDWFWEGYGAYLLDVWLAPILWLAEIEIFHFYWSYQRKVYSIPS